MSFDPLAVRSAFRSLPPFLERLAAELRDRRGELEAALSDLLLIWDIGAGPHELAARLAALGDAVRDARLTDEVRRMHDVRAASPHRMTGTGMDVALALLDAAVGEQQDRVADLLARLDEEHRDQAAGVRAALARVAEQLLVVWCDRPAKDFPARFRDEVKRLGLDLYRVEQWHLDDAPKLTPDAGLVLDGLMNGMPFSVSWLDEPLDLDEANRETTDGESAPSAVNAPITDEVNVPVPTNSKVMLGSPVTDPFADLLTASLSLRLKGKEKAVIELLCRRRSPVPLADVAMVCEWVVQGHHGTMPTPTAAYADDWNSLRYRLNTKLKKHGWELSRHDGCAVAERVPGGAGK